MLDIRALPDEDMTKFYAEMERIIGDPAVKVVPTGAGGRPLRPPSRLDTEMFRALEAAQRRLYPGAITVPGMVTGATDLAQLARKACRPTASVRDSMKPNSPSTVGTATSSG